MDIIEITEYKSDFAVIQILMKGRKTRGHEHDNDNSNKSDIFHDEIKSVIKK